jgi:hypothetical protein
MECTILGEHGGLEGSPGPPPASDPYEGRWVCGCRTQDGPTGNVWLVERFVYHISFSSIAAAEDNALHNPRLLATLSHH